MTFKEAALFVLVQIGLLYLYGIRNLFGKWLVRVTLRVAKKWLIKSERDLAIFLHYYNGRHKG